MNKYKEAFKGLVMLSFCKQCVNLYKTKECTKNDCYKKVKALQELVEKATPKKPKELCVPDDFGFTLYTRCMCPNCYGEIANVWRRKKGNEPNCCPNCGQTIDWSEDTKIL